MKCPQCGHDNPEVAQFCRGCGTLIGREAYVRAELPLVGFVEAIKRGFRNYATFSGRATRAEYWWWALFTTLSISWLSLFVVGVTLVLSLEWLSSSVIMFALSLSLMGLGYLIGMACWIPTISVAIRRLHDIGKSGLWVLLVQIPFPVVLLTTVLVLGMFGYGMGHQGYSEVPPKLDWLDKVLITAVVLDGVAALIIIPGSLLQIIWLSRKGDTGSNKYGPDPRLATSQ